jgi:hypothetical protein
VPMDWMPSLKELNKLLPHGESFFITAIQSQVVQDHILAFIQFKRFKKAAFINLLATRPGTFSKGLFGSSPRFMDPEVTFRNMRLALLLIRALQLYMCSLDSPPTLYIQVKVNSSLETYLKNLGFEIYNISNILKEKCIQEAAVGFFDDKGYVVLKIATIVKPNEVLSDTVGEVVQYCAGTFFENHILKKTPIDEIYPPEEGLFHFPFSVSGNFVD